MTEESTPAPNLAPSSEDSPPKKRNSHNGLLNPSSLLHQPRMLLGALLMYGGMGIYVLFRSETPFSILLERYGSTALALTMGIAGFYLFFSEFTKWRLLRESRFVDVDERTRAPSSSLEYEALTARLNEIQSNLMATQLVTSPNEEAVERTPEGGNASPTSFVIYFDALRRLLEQKAAIADEKASILLDKGTTYSRFGIIFFIFCIAAWQALSYWTGFQKQYIYGIVSTSLLFVFIEFLSAWFLKQYRQFIDTSTYLIKVKSIFDRYMLVYLASKEAIADGHDAKKSTHLLLDLLRSDISWPDTYLTKSPDISFAKEALETMTLLVKSMKSEAKEAAKQGSAIGAKKAARTDT